MDELLTHEIFYTLKEAQIMIEAWSRHYNTIRPHSSLGYRPLANEAIVCSGQQNRWHKMQLKLTFKTDHPSGAGHCYVPTPQRFF
ncbi:MAG: transposase [Rhizobiales bacterium]|nr:transposase [Hyphomicrobiales bacterium]